METWRGRPEGIFVRGIAVGALLEGLLLGLLGVGVPGWPQGRPWLLVPALILGG